MTYEGRRKTTIAARNRKKQKMIVNDFGTTVPAGPSVTVPERVQPSLTDIAARPQVVPELSYIPEYTRFPHTCSGETKKICGCQTKRKQSWCSETGCFQFDWDAVASTVARFTTFY